MPSLGPRTPQPSGPALSAWELIARVYEASLSPETWDSVFQGLGALIEARPTTAVLRGFGPTRHVNCDNPSEAFHEINPVQMFTTKALSRRGFVIAVVNDAVIEEWAEWAALPSESADTSSLILFNPQGGLLSDVARTTLRRVLPHVHKALQIHFTLQQFEREHESLTHCLDALGHAVMLLDVNANVLFANQAARRAAEKTPTIAINGYQLEFRNTNDQLLTIDLVRRAVESIGEPCAVRLSNDLSLYAYGRDESRAAVLLVDANVERGLSPSLLEQGLKLTPAEAQVGALFARGHSPSEIGSRLSMPQDSVRGYIKQIQVKTGSSRQSELVTRLLTALPHFVTD